MGQERGEGEGERKGQDWAGIRTEDGGHDACAGVTVCCCVWATDANFGEGREAGGGEFGGGAFGRHSVGGDVERFVRMLKMRCYRCLSIVNDEASGEVCNCSSKRAELMTFLEVPR